MTGRSELKREGGESMAVRNISQVPGLRRLTVMGQRTTIDQLEGKSIIIRDFIEVPNTKFGPQGGTYLRITGDVAGTGSSSTTYTFNTSSTQIKQTLTNAQSNLPVQLKVCKVLSGNNFYFWTLQP